LNKTIESCLIIGGEIAAIRAAHDLLALGVPVTLINYSDELCEKSKMFQRGITDFVYKKDIITPHLKDLESNPKFTLINNVQKIKVDRKESPFEIEIEYNGTSRNLITKTVIFATGFKPFNIEKLEEYGYGVLEGVITIFDLEKNTQNNNLTINEKIQRLIFVLCAGSRITRGNPDCSSYCCSYSINQALTIKKMYPHIDVVIMYMDIRTVANQEFLYNEARKSGVIFVRGRPSAIERSNTKLITLFEDTLAEKQDLLPADLIILAVGGVPYPGSDDLATNFGLQLNHNNFIKVIEKPVTTSTPGVFACGSACDGIKNIQQSLSEGGAAAMAVVKFLKRI
jgi:heterodisulfide reductase subunit A-like polyferredoxin